jgi:hypothetical protein
MITLLIWLLVLVLVFGVVLYVVQLLPLPAPFGQIALAVVALIFVLLIISMLLGGIPLQPVRLP